ncbi:MAG TPA: hypothetical protein VHH88_09185 [Verrucomicrobiae bacterium]|nr:hypothetical protein [Verrucomicrobiae bacterium]
MAAQNIARQLRRLEDFTVVWVDQNERVSTAYREEFAIRAQRDDLRACPWQVDLNSGGGEDLIDGN